MSLWTTIRTLVAQIGESATPSAVALGVSAPHVEFVFDTITTPSVPTSVVFTFWRGVDGNVDKICTLTVAAADLATMPPRILSGVDASNVAVTVAFVGGSTPTISGVIRARPLFGAVYGRQSADDRAFDATEATAANQTAAIALTGTIRHTTTPSKADVATGPAEVDKRGNAFISGTIRHWRYLPLASAFAAAQTAGTLGAGTSLAEGACDALRVDTDDTIVYCQPVERDPIVLQTAGAWTATAGWAFVGTVATHTAGTTTLSQDTAVTHAADPIVARYYAVQYTITGRTAGSVVASLGATAGLTRSGNGIFTEIILSTTGVIAFTPSTDFDGSIDVASVRAVPGTLPLKAGAWDTWSAVKVLCCATSAAPGTLGAAAVYAGWYRRPGATEQA